ncbi:hypothetical protein HXX01_01460 [Candidatus Nomurabacteria bacterium]|nr:hypothetical protein [Candidatus Nomurabacteria bacterium]
MKNKVIVILIPEDSDMELVEKSILDIGGEILLERKLSEPQEAVVGNERKKRVIITGVPITLGFSLHYPGLNLCSDLDLKGGPNEDFDDLVLSFPKRPASVIKFEREMSIDQIDQVELLPIINSKSKETVLFLQNYGHTFKGKVFTGKTSGNRRMRQKRF